MIKKLSVVSAFIWLAACNNDEYQKAEDAQDAGREFVRASLDGNYDKAKFYLLKNEDNLMLLDRWKEMYGKYPAETIRGFKNASIRPISIESINDSTTRYIYSNSFTKDTTELNIIRVNSEWLVDLKTFIGK
jgi:hypothetical protein